MPIRCMDLGFNPIKKRALNMGDFKFDFPQAAWLLALTPLLAFCLLWLFRYHQRIVQLYNPEHATQLVYPRSKTISFLKSIAWLLVWICACIALMGPKGNLKYLPNPNESFSSKIDKRPIQEIIFLVDTSASMSIPDGRNNIPRLSNAKEIMDEVTSQLKGQYVSLYAFTSQLTPLVPPTLDYLFTRLIINQLDINAGDVGGTNLTRVLESLKQKLFAETTTKLYTLILLSDGGDNVIEKMEGKNKQQAIAQLASIFADHPGIDLSFSTVGIGSIAGDNVPGILFGGQPVHSVLEQDVLKQLAIRGGGDYYQANEWNTWNLAQNLVAKAEQQAKKAQTSPLSGERVVKPVQEEDISYDLYYQIPLGIALLLLMIIYILPNTRLLHL